MDIASANRYLSQLEATTQAIATHFQYEHSRELARLFAGLARDQKNVALLMLKEIELLQKEVAALKQAAAPSAPAE